MSLDIKQDFYILAIYINSDRRMDTQTHASLARIESAVNSTCPPHEEAGKVGLRLSTSKLVSYIGRTVEAVKCHQRMNEQNAVRTCGGMLFSPTKEENSDTCYDTDEL